MKIISEVGAAPQFHENSPFIHEIDDIKNEYYKLMNSKFHPVYPPLWDGKTANRCLESILNYKS